MYAIVYWLKDDEVYPHQTPDKQIKVFSTLKEADAEADKLEKEIGAPQYTSCRVVSLEQVHE